MKTMKIRVMVQGIEEIATITVMTTKTMKMRVKTVKMEKKGKVVMKARAIMSITTIIMALTKGMKRTMVGIETRGTVP